MTEIAIAPERSQVDRYQVVDGSGSVAVANSVQQAEASRDSSYGVDYQPTYKDPKALNEVLLGLAGEEGVTTPGNIDNVRAQYSKIALNEDSSMVLVTGPCAEPVLITQDIDKMSQRYLNLIQIGKKFRAVQALRACGQSAKPRSSEYEELENGDKVPSYYGDMINSKDVSDREPDPDRMLVTAQQSKDVQDSLTQLTGRHVTVTHEALLKVYEESFIVKEDGKKYLTSCDIPWIGKRTNDPDGDHVAMLSDIENPVGVKIGPKDSPDKIAGLAKALNPNPKENPGKLVFIMRFGYLGIKEAHEQLVAIKEHAPGSIILCDPMHENTVKAKNGQKTRELPKIISEIRSLSEMCRLHGLRLHGLHLEASGDNDREECVDAVGGEPKHSSLVDPELNNQQLIKVLEETRECFFDKVRVNSIRQEGGFVVIPR